jgi:hypothetical protein
MYSLVDRRATHHKITEKIETKQQELPNRVTAPVLASLLDFPLFSIIYFSDKRTVSTGSPKSISRLTEAMTSENTLKGCPSGAESH